MLQEKNKKSRTFLSSVDYIKKTPLEHDDHNLEISFYHKVLMKSASVDSSTV